MLFGCNVLYVYPWKCAPMNNRESKVRPEITNINSNGSSLYAYTVKISKCSGSCNNTNDPYANFSVPDAVKNINVKVIKFMSRTNEIRYTKWHETCKCKCRWDASIFNNKQCWNKDKCRCEC